ncbi:hypothetical protein SDC9_31801 [bioreactor metagenome]|uniref:Uncharacterized protein n=1 Tax=bioreactor metagenome TaxID=1076179 RepID=A0A644V3Q1_9ZZZZ
MSVATAFNVTCGVAFAVYTFTLLFVIVVYRFEFDGINCSTFGVIPATGVVVGVTHTNCPATTIPSLLTFFAEPLVKSASAKVCP